MVGQIMEFAFNRGNDSFIEAYPKFFDERLSEKSLETRHFEPRKGWGYLVDIHYKYGKVEGATISSIFTNGIRPQYINFLESLGFTQNN